MLHIFIFGFVKLLFTSVLCLFPGVQTETVRETVNVNEVQKEGVPEVETETVTVKGAGGPEGV